MTQNYSSADIYNADKNLLVFHLPPNKSLPGSSVNGQKNKKVRLTFKKTAN